ncbi:kinase-like domain-containing protein [Gigaspora rosea]|uniref:Kinase-like domain-containing protein n=1 Tax=Gigaspora rosea TaxID=44941 RepID=A0A397V4A6_9GLOM|nr:kinase-like domain-containing protein [Gigaspora rosea]
MGSLRSNLHYVSQMEWEKKLNLLHCIASDLQIIHSQEFIHRDLHSGNILQNKLYNAYVADLGLSILKKTALKAEHCGIYGILPYIAPETLERGQYTTASDIYSFGIIMWEILYGRPVSYSQELGTQLQIEICRNDLRPTIIENTHQRYVNLMKECWEIEPENRPSAIKICEILTEWLNNEFILSDLTKSDKLLKILKNTKSTHTQPYSDDIYKSKFIKYTTSLCQNSGLNDLNIPSDKL